MTSCDVCPTKAHSIAPQQDGQDVGVVLCWWQGRSVLCDRLGEGCPNIGSAPHHRTECRAKDSATTATTIILLDRRMLLAFNIVEPGTAIAFATPSRYR